MLLSEDIFLGDGSYSGDYVPSCIHPAHKKLIFFTSEALVAQRHLNDILPFLRQQNIIPIVILTPPTKSSRASIPSLQKFYYYEEGILGDIIYPELDKIKFNGKSQLVPTFNQMVSMYDVDYIDIDSIKNPIIDSIINLPNVMGAISIYQDCIFKEDLINKIKSKGFFWNLHPAVLPEDKGVYLAFWNLLEGKKLHGNSLHEIDVGIDTGRVISSCQGKLNPEKPIIESYLDFTECGSRLIIQAVAEYIQKGRISYAPEIGVQVKDVKYKSFPSEDDISNAQKRGVRLIGSIDETLSMYKRNFGNNPTMLRNVFHAISLIESEGYDFLEQNLIVTKGHGRAIATNIEEISSPLMT